MSEAKFTKGEWEFDRSIERIVDAEGETICATGGSWDFYKNAEANAALIAAAPEMYGILEHILSVYEMDYDDTNKALKLLAKARGEK